MAHDHTFDCKICGEHLDSQEDLDRHKKSKHTQQASPSQSKSSADSLGSDMNSRTNDSERL